MTLDPLERIHSGLMSGTPDDVKRAIADAFALVECQHGNRWGCARFGEGFQATMEHVDGLARMLTDYVPRACSPGLRASALHVLGKLLRRDLLGFFEHWLEASSGSHPEHEPLFQCLMALDALGENVLPPDGGNVLDGEANVGYARTWLTRRRQAAR